MQTARRGGEIGALGFQPKVPASTSKFRFKDLTFALFRRSASLIPARAPAVSAVLFPFWAERLLAVFQIDAGGRFPRSLWKAAQISLQGSAAREVYASVPPVDAVAVAAIVVAAAVDAVVFEAAAAVADGIAVAVVAPVAVAPGVAAADAVVFEVAATVADGIAVAVLAFAVAFAVPARRPAGMTSTVAARH